MTVDNRPVSQLKRPNFLIWIFLLAFFLRMIWLETVVARDEGTAGYIAMVWLQGHPPYSPPMSADSPPMAYLIYMASIVPFGNTIIPVRVINDALFLLSVPAIYIIAKRWYSQGVASISAFFYAVFMNAPIFETQLAIPSSLGVSFMVFSVFLYSRYQSKGSTVALLLSGILSSIASLIAQYFILTSIMLFVLFSIATLKHETRPPNHLGFGKGLA